MASRFHEPSTDRRDGMRSRAVLALGKIMHNGREGICIVREISARGMRIEMTDPPAPDSYVIVEMLGLVPTPARIAWRQQGVAGLAFGMMRDLDRLCRPGREPDGTAARGPRFAVNQLAALRTDGRYLPVRIVNISVGGARLAGTRGMTAQAPGRIDMTDVNISLAGYIRWSCGDEAGFSFSPALDFATLSRAVEGNPR